MPTYGITSTGFAIKPVDAILSEIEQLELQLISAGLDLQPTNPIGVLNGIFAQALADLWQQLAALYSGMSPDTATGDQLSSLALLTGTRRFDATKTQAAQCTVTIANGFSALPGTMFASVVGNPGALFTNKTLVANSSGITTTPLVDFQAVATGSVACPVGGLTIIAQPLTGWLAITGPLVPFLGSGIETDSALRLRRTAELAAAGGDTADAIRSAVLLQMVVPNTSSNTTSCTVLYNDTDATDSNGLTPHSIEVIAYQPGYDPTRDDPALAALIFREKAAGINTRGTSAVVITDSQGNLETISFTRPTIVRLYAAITVTVSDKLTAPTGTLINSITAALSLYVSQTPPGAILYIKHLADQVFAPTAVIIDSQGHPVTITPLSPFTGVLDWGPFTIDTNPVPVGVVNIPLTVRQVVVLAQADITVSVHRI